MSAVACWECRREPQPQGPQILERCEAHLRAALRKMMALDEPRTHADFLPNVAHQELSRKADIMIAAAKIKIEQTLVDSLWEDMQRERQTPSLDALPYVEDD